MLLALGMFEFSAANVSYNQLQRRTSWRHAGQPRVGAREASQFVGPGDDIITLTGVLPHGLIGRSEALKDLRDMGERGAAWPLVGGDGTVFGAFIITDLDETQRAIVLDGRPRLSDFTLSLKHVDEDQDPEADATSRMIGALDLGRLVGLY